MLCATNMDGPIAKKEGIEGDLDKSISREYGTESSISSKSKSQKSRGPNSILSGDDPEPNGTVTKDSHSKTRKSPEEMDVDEELVKKVNGSNESLNSSKSSGSSGRSNGSEVGGKTSKSTGSKDTPPEEDNYSEAPYITTNVAKLKIESAPGTPIESVTKDSDSIVPSRRTSMIRREGSFSTPSNSRKNTVDRDVPRSDISLFDESAYNARLAYIHVDQNEFKNGATGSAETIEAPCECTFTHGVHSHDEACGLESDCINRILCIECSSDCPCGSYCQNQSFQRREYAKVQVFKTEKKGHGVRALEDLLPGQFVIEYCGEVLPRHIFNKRIKEYSANNFKHFYFMALQGDEVIDATKKGNMSRFINHSCAPNCVLEKWTVGNKSRMGIFTKKFIAAGEELAFDYRFQRYGEEAQKCYCGAPECKGYIGSKAKGDAPDLTIVDDYSEEEEDTTDTEEVQTSKRKSSKKSIVPLSTVEEATAAVKDLFRHMGSPNKVRKILERLEATDTAQVWSRFLRMHGLLVLKSCLRGFKTNNLICRLILKVYKKMPLGSKNTLVEQKILDMVSELVEHRSPEIGALAQELVDSWSSLQIVYRIPKAKPPALTRTDSTTTASSTSTGHSTSSLAGQKRPLEDDDSVGAGYMSNVSSSHSLNHSGRYEDKRQRNGSEFSRRSSMTDFEYRNNKYQQQQGSNASLRERYDSYRPERERERGRDWERDRYRDELRNGIDRSKLKPGWEVAYNDDKIPYFYHVETKEVTWDFPSIEVDSTKAETSGADKDESGKSTDGDKDSSVPPPAAPLSSPPRRAVVEVDDSMIDEMVRKAKEKMESIANSAAAATDAANGDDTKPVKKRSSKSKDVTLVEKNDKSVKKLKERMAQYVTKYLSAYKHALDKDTFKMHAKKVTERVLDKETKGKALIAPIVTDKIKRKIKTYIEDEYVKKHFADIIAKKPENGTSSTNGGVNGDEDSDDDVEMMDSEVKEDLGYIPLSPQKPI